MPIIGNTYDTLLDHALRTDPNGSLPEIVKLIDQVNELDDIPVIRGNLETGVLTVRRIGLPEITRRKVNQGVKPSKQKTDQITDTAITYESHSVVDFDELAIAEDKKGERLQIAGSHLQAMAEARASDMFYGKASDGAFNGFATHYNKIGEQVIDAKGTSNLSSVFCIGWAPNTITSFYPKNSTTAGIIHMPSEKPERVPAPDGSNTFMMAYTDVFKWMTGLAVRNYKFGSRIANLDIENTAINDLVALFIKAKNRLPSLKVCMPRFYCNETIYTALEIAAVNKANVNLTIERLENDTKILSILGIPIRRIDALKNGESKVA